MSSSSLFEWYLSLSENAPLFFLCCQRKKQRELLGIGTHAMLPHAPARENGSPKILSRHRRFPNARIAPSLIATDSELMVSTFVGPDRNRWVRAGEGFTRRVSISVHKHNDRIQRQYFCAEIDSMCGWD